MVKIKNKNKKKTKETRSLTVIDYQKNAFREKEILYSLMMTSYKIIF